MPDTKISALTAASAGLAADEFAINEAGASKKLTLQQIANFMPAAAGSPDPGHVFGAGAAWWYIPGNMIFGASTKAINANFMSYFPWYLDVAWTFDTLAVEVTTLGAGLMRAGLYNADTKWQPTTLVQDFGTFDVSTTGLKSKTITALPLPAGRYIACLVDNVNTTIRVANTMSHAIGAGNGLGANIIPYEWYRAFTYAALPADGTTIPWTTPSYGASYHVSGLFARNSTGG